jgi:hypothetical protein
MLCGDTEGGSPTRTARHAWHQCQHLQHHRRQSDKLRSEHILRGLSADACGVVAPPTVDAGSGINWTNAAVVRPYDGPMNMPSDVLRLGDTRTLVPVWLIDTWIHNRGLLGVVTRHHRHPTMGQGSARHHRQHRRVWPTDSRTIVATNHRAMVCRRAQSATVVQHTSALLNGCLPQTTHLQRQRQHSRSLCRRHATRHQPERQ